MVVCAINPSTLEAEQADLWVWGHSNIQSKFQDSYDYTEKYQIIKKNVELKFIMKSLKIESEICINFPFHIHI